MDVSSMYFEDNDLCLSFEEAGYKIIVHPLLCSRPFLWKRVHIEMQKLFRVF